MTRPAVQTTGVGIIRCARDLALRREVLSMRKYVLLVVCVSAFGAVACRGASPERELKDSFLQQVGSSPGVRDFQRGGDEVSFTARYGNALDAKWRVHIDSSSIELETDGKTPNKGGIKSTWSVNGEPIRPRGSQSDLPLGFLDNGVAQECWALWDGKTGKWSWK
jgi:hypothetical protein